MISYGVKMLNKAYDVDPNLPFYILDDEQYRHICRDQFSRIVRKPAFRICENKDADQLRGNRKADQGLCFHYEASTIPLLPKYEILSL